ncbi:MAG TPA: hypothetical protein VKE70_26490 [Candidatus Solibacter sp.]|nr:hypothetical protein [Candidatus Solibacter sp.]
MSVGVQDYGNFAGEFFGLVQQRGDPQARDHLVTEAFDAIAFAGKYVQPFHASLGFGPLVALSAQNHFVQQLTAQLLFGQGPLLSGADRRHGSDFRSGIYLDFHKRLVRSQNGLCQCVLKTERLRGHGQARGKPEHEQLEDRHQVVC